MADLSSQMTLSVEESSAGGSGGGGGGDTQNVKVMTRVRLFNKREIEMSESKKQALIPCIRMRDKTCAVLEHYTDDNGFPQEREKEAFEFDECFWSMPLEQAHSGQPYASQQYVYERSGLLALQAALGGYNVTIFAYGQTGSGKTYSMLGAPTDPGISPRLVDDLFGKERNQMVKTTVECMFFEIYNEKVRDLFNKNQKAENYEPPKIRQHPTKGVYIEGLMRKETATADQTKHLIDKGTKERAMAETKMNATSSRSHAVFQIVITQVDPMKGTQRVSIVNLVDLAGSERIKMSGAKDKVLDEAKAINQSLSTLRKVIDVLIENSKIRNKKNHRLAPFRESVLTYVLSDSLGGNSKTMMIATISPHSTNMEDTINTLRYALRAKAIVCDAKVNEGRSAIVLDQMREEIMALQQKLRTGGGAISADIQAQIEEREREVEKMEEQQKQMEAEIQEMQQKGAELMEKFKEKEEERAAMQVEVDAQKKERFATAFRNAFLINTEKKKQEATQQLSIELEARNKALEREVAYLSTELENKTEMFDELRASTEVRIDELTSGLAQREGMLAQLRRQVGTTNEELRFMKDQNQQLLLKVQTLDGTREDLEKRVQRQLQELLAANASVDRLQSEKARMAEVAEEDKKAAANELDNMRKRRDKYKLLYMEAQAKSEASRTVIESLHGDRQSFLSTIQAQQRVLDEQSVTVQRMSADRRDSEDKSRRLERTVMQKEHDATLMAEALREYQAAATEFVYENHSMKRELERRSAMSPSYADPVTPVSIARGSADYASPSSQRPPKRTNSPSMMMTRQMTPPRAASPHASVSALRHVSNGYSPR